MTLELLKKLVEKEVEAVQAEMSVETDLESSHYLSGKFNTLQQVLRWMEKA